MEFFGLLGESLGHSLSPRIHQMAFERLGVQGAYKLMPVNQKKVSQVAEALKLLGIRGINVTIPYKQVIMDQLDDISREAKEIGAVNTLALTHRGLIGYNTDYDGFAQLLKYYGIEIKGKKAAILGTGGVAQAIKAVLLDGDIDTLYWVTRDEAVFSEKLIHLDYRIKVINYQELWGCQGDILINATPVGMAPNSQPSPVGQGCIANFATLVDTIYNPLETTFMSIGRKLGKQVCGGLYMLVAQAMKSQEIWQNQKVSKEVIQEIYHTLLAEYDPLPKICLIGMPGSGKTTLGKKLAAKLDRNFIDMDQYIEKISGLSIADLFAQGETVFRQWETEACKRLASLRSGVIACGGGVVLNSLNLEWLQKDGGILIFIDRPLDDIAADLHIESRPLLKNNPDQLSLLYQRRYPLYCQATGWQVKSKGSVDEALKQLLGLVESLEGKAKGG